jgi:hypothetical protein
LFVRDEVVRSIEFRFGGVDFWLRSGVFFGFGFGSHVFFRLCFAFSIDWYISGSDRFACGLGGGLGLWRRRRLAFRFCFDFDLDFGFDFGSWSAELLAGSLQMSDIDLWFEGCHF